MFVIFFSFFFQAEDGIRDKLVTGVQTCALPIFPPDAKRSVPQAPEPAPNLPRRVERNRRQRGEHASADRVLHPVTKIRLYDGHESPVPLVPLVERSEERRVGKECRSRRWPDQ